MNNNDEKIKNLLAVIESKRSQLGPKPRISLRTNGLIKTATESVNINTIRSLEVCVELAGKILLEKKCQEEAAKFFGFDPDLLDKSNDNLLLDLKDRAELLIWESKNRLIIEKEKRLKDLRSEEAKTDDALSLIASELGL